MANVLGYRQGHGWGGRQVWAPRLPRWSVYSLVRTCLAFLAVVLARPVAAQAPLYLIDDETVVREISFKFAGTQTFSEDRLKEQIATAEPGFWDQVRRWLPLIDAPTYPFDPVELQRDVIRLRRFYGNHGFLHPIIDYRASQLDTTDNAIHIIFGIEEGPPLIIQDVSFVSPEGTNAFYQFPEDLRERWVAFRDEVTVHTGQRFQNFDVIRIKDTIIRWLQNRGYAFAVVESDVDVDTLQNVVDLSFLVDAGPLTHIDEIVIDDGEDEVDHELVLRELPFDVGDRFSFRKLLQGQRELFALQLFRVAITEVPAEQPRDSTVTVLVRVRTARPRYVSAQTGYARENGFEVRGQWTHRNFLGGARVFQAGALAETGLGATPPLGGQSSRTLNATVSLKQPYLFTTRLSGIVAPFIQYEQNPQFVNVDEFLGFNTREIGVNTTLIYEFFPFRTLTLQHTYVRALILSRAIDVTRTDTLILDRVRDPHNRSIFSLSGLFGRVDDYVQPNNGWLVRPLAEAAGTILGSDIDYYKLSTEATGYFDVGQWFTRTDQFSLAGRLFAGKIWPIGRSREALFGDLPWRDSLRFEQRFDPILFYAGGPTLRGWGYRMAGEKVPVILDTLSDGTRRFVYEALGGTVNIGGNLEVRMPFPGLGENWRTAAFFDAAMLGNGINDADLFSNVGAGIRYRTPVGFIRLDLALKLNAECEDLVSPQAAFRGECDEDDPEKKWTRRFNLQLSIGQAF